MRRQSFHLLAEVVALLFVGLVGVIADVSGIALILFPELAALTQDVITRPRGRWAARPAQLVVTPTLTAIIGLSLTRSLPYGVLPMVLIVALSLVTIKLTRSTVAPAISAGLLPMVLGERSWLYPAAIFAGTSMLVAALLVWRQSVVCEEAPGNGEEEHSAVVEAMEAEPSDRFWAAALMLFVFVVGAAAQFTGLRLLLFPPLVVMAYELFGHPEVPGWMKQPVLFPVACSTTASIGLAAYHFVHPVFFAVAITMLCSIAVLRAFAVHMPPALAVGLLPFVMAAPDYHFPLSVLLGTTALTLYFFAYKRLRLPTGQAIQRVA